jgi:hypothetical protein
MGPQRLNHFDDTLAGSEAPEQANHHEAPKEMKKGAGASPLNRTDPPINQNRVEVRFRPPREANLVSCGRREQ